MSSATNKRTKDALKDANQQRGASAQGDFQDGGSLLKFCGKDHLKLQEWTEQYRVKFFRTSERMGSEPAVLGKYGEILDTLPGETERFAEQQKVRLVMLLTAVPRNATMPKALLSRRRQALAGDMDLGQTNGDESILYFDPASKEQSRLAILLVGAKKKRTVNLTEEQKDALRTRLAAMRASKVLPIAA